MGQCGELFIADTSNSRIRKVDTAGTMSTVAGIGTAGFTGDGGPAAGARINLPYAVILDQAGNISFPDFGNNRVRKVGTAGTVTTVAGTGDLLFGGDGGPAIGASLSSPLGLATNTRLFQPRGVALDAAGTLYLADLALAASEKSRLLRPAWRSPAA